MDANIERAEAISELQSILLATSSIEELVQGIADDAADRLAPDAEVTVTLRRDGRLGVVASSGDRARACDEVEYAAGDGPCVEAVETGHPTYAPDLAAEIRWPLWCEAARQAGFRSGAAFPAAVDEGTRVAINVYAAAPGGWAGAATERGIMYAAEVARAVQLSMRVARAAETTEDLRAALASRTVIDQAIGVIMGQNRCSPQEAMAMLRAASQHRNVKLRDVAATIVGNVGGATAGTSSPFVERTS